MTADSLHQNLLTHLEEVVRDRDPFFAPTGHLYVREYIREQLAQWGSVETHEFEYRGGTHQNLILNLPSRKEQERQHQAHQAHQTSPTSQPSEHTASHSTEADRPLPSFSQLPILIGAHYDAVPGTPGADDNATGVAVLLELARAFAAEPAKHPLQLVAFDLEEMGMVGSRAYATQLQQNGQHLRLMISLEMIGYCDRTPGSQKYPAGLERFYPNRGDFIGFIGNWQTIPDLIHLSRTMRKAGPVPAEWLPAGKRGMIVPETRLSDHSPFWDAGYRAMMVTDTSFMRNPHYHQGSDRLTTLDLEFLTGVCRGLIHGIRSL